MGKIAVPCGQCGRETAGFFKENDKIGLCEKCQKIYCEKCVKTFSRKKCPTCGKGVKITGSIKQWPQHWASPIAENQNNTPLSSTLPQTTLQPNPNIVISVASTAAQKACKKCGKLLLESAQFCDNCGKKQK